MKYELITRYIDFFNGESAGRWIYDEENDGSLERPFQLGYVEYSKMAMDFVKDFMAFVDDDDNSELNNYTKILNENGIEWGIDSMTEVDADMLDADCILALILAAIRADRFSEGALLEFIRNGSMNKWLKRLKELDG